jgi:hypothetical protein
MQKRCSKCGLVKPITEFYLKSESNAYRTCCRQCSLARLEQWQRDNAARLNAERVKNLNRIYHDAHLRH